MLEGIFSHLSPILKGLPFAVLPLANRGPGRPPLDDDPETVLLSERRREIFDLIQREPGISSLQVQRALDVGAGVYYHHLDRLVRAGLVEKRKAGSVSHLYPTDKAPPPDAPALAHETAKEVASMVLEKPGLSSTELAEALGRPQRTVLFHLRNLFEKGYVRHQRGWGSPKYHPTTKLRKALLRK